MVVSATAQRRWCAWCAPGAFLHPPPVPSDPMQLVRDTWAGSLRWMLHFAFFSGRSNLEVLVFKSELFGWFNWKGPSFRWKTSWASAEIPVKRHPKHGEDWVQTHHPQRPIGKVWNLRWLYTKKATSTRIQLFLSHQNCVSNFHSKARQMRCRCHASGRVRDSAPKPPRMQANCVPVPRWPQSPGGAMAIWSTFHRLSQSPYLLRGHLESGINSVVLEPNREPRNELET